MNLPVSPDPPNETGEREPPVRVPPGRSDGNSDRVRAPVTRKQLDEIFGEVLPTVTRDELDDGQDRAVDDDRWYRDNRPPHHG